MSRKCPICGFEPFAHDDHGNGGCFCEILRPSAIDEAIKAARPLTQKHILNVCKVKTGGAETCAFLGIDGKGFSCTKNTPWESGVRQQITEGNMVAKGDNCVGRTGIVSDLPTG